MIKSVLIKIFILLLFQPIAIAKIKSENLFPSNRVFFQIESLLKNDSTHISLERFQQIEKTVEKLDSLNLFINIVIQKNSEQNSPAISYQISKQKFLISTRWELIPWLPKSAVNLILMHEVGHVRLGHHKLLTLTPEKWVDYEIEADIFAALAYKKFYKRTAKLSEFIDFVNTNNNTKPSGVLRAKIFRIILEM